MEKSKVVLFQESTFSRFPIDSPGVVLFSQLQKYSPARFSMCGLF